MERLKGVQTKLDLLQIRDITQQDFLYSVGGKVENQYSYYIEENLLGENDGELAIFTTQQEIKEFYKSTIKLSDEEKKKMKELKSIIAEMKQTPIESIKITIEWKKNNTWGHNPIAEGLIKFKDGAFIYERATASGCGYDKESTVIADIFNRVLKYRLWELHDEIERDKSKVPYGIHTDKNERVYFGGGIGTSCYYAICEYLGFTFKHIATGTSFDVFEVCKKEREEL